MEITRGFVMTEFAKSTSLKATTKLACDIAHVDADRLNEAISGNFYPCA